jgi:hypothetical protein
MLTFPLWRCLDRMRFRAQDDAIQYMIWAILVSDIVHRSYRPSLIRLRFESGFRVGEKGLGHGVFGV